MPRIDLSKTAQERHDRALSRALKKMKKWTPDEKAESKRKLEALLAQKAAPKSFDPIKNAMRNHPGLTREEAEKWADAFGF